MPSNNNNNNNKLLLLNTYQVFLILCTNLPLNEFALFSKMLTLCFSFIIDITLHFVLRVVSILRFNSCYCFFSANNRPITMFIMRF